MSEPAQCANCDFPQAVAGQRYCPSCGERTPVERIGWPYLRRELTKTLLPDDGGVFYTVWRLLWKPGYFIREYLHGRRAGIAKPHLVVSSTALGVVLLSHVTQSVVPLTGLQGSASALMIAGNGGVARWLNGNLGAFALVMVPLEAWILSRVFRRQAGFNYPEWLVITAFLSAQVNLLWMALLLLGALEPAFAALLLPAVVVWRLITLVEFFRPAPASVIVTRGLTAMALYTLAFAVLLGIALVLGVALLAAGFATRP